MKRILNDLKKKKFIFGKAGERNPGEKYRVRKNLQGDVPGMYLKWLQLSSLEKA